MKKSYLNSERNSAVSLKPSMTIRLLLVVLFVCLFGSVNSVSAATRTASVSGNWNSTTTWGGATIPTNADDVTINSGIIVTLTGSSAVAKTLTINLGGTFTVSTIAITVSGATTVLGTLTHISTTGTKTYTGKVTIQSSGTWNNSGNSNINFRGGLTNNGTFNAGTGIYTFTNNSQVLEGTIDIPRATVTGVALTNNGTLTVATALAGTGTLTNSGSGTLNIGGACSIGITTGGIANSGTINLTGTGKTTTGVTRFTNTGTINLNGSETIAGITNNAAGIVNLASSGTIASFNNATATSTLNISALTVPITTLTVSTAGNTVNYSGSGNQIQIIKTLVYSNLILSGSGTKTLAGNTTVNKDITIDSGVTLDITTFDLDVSGNIILNGTCESSTVNQSSKGKVAWNPTLSGGTLYGDNGTFSNIDQLETNGNITIDSNATITFNNASIDGQGKSITNNGIVNVTGTESFVIDDALTWNNIGTLNYGLSTTPNILTLNASASGNTVNYTGTNQVIKETTYDNLTLSGSGIKTFGAATTINNTLSIATDVVANLGAFSHTASVLILGVEDVSGFWGSSSSPAVNPDDIFFAATTGTVNSSCSAPTITTQPVAKTICENTVESFSITSSGASFQWQYLKNGTWTNTNSLVGFSGHNTHTLTMNAIPYNYNGYSMRCIVRSSGGCRTNSNAVLLTVKAKPATPSATITHPDCKTETGSVVLTDLQAYGTLNQTGYATASPAYEENTTTITGLFPGTYYFAVTSASGCTSSTVEVIINQKPLLPTTWTTAGGWDNGIPDRTKAIVFADSYSLDNNIVGCSCQVNDGKFVTIAANRTLTLTYELNVIGNGTLSFLDGASLVQINNVATNNNTGDIQYYRSTYSRKTDYNYLSSPVSPSLGDLGPQILGEIATDLSNGTFYSYKPSDTGGDWDPESAETIMDACKGYIATRSSEIPQSNATIPQLELQFSGIPNNGHYEIADIIENSSYLLGNPYPSALDADTFLNSNAGVLNGTLYFWTHNTAMKDRALILTNSAGSGAYAYTSDDYATYNATGGVAANNIDLLAETGSAPSGNGIGTNNNQPPTGKIASGQGFFASSQLTIPANSKIIFDNTMRVGVNGITGNNSQFFKTKKPNGKTAKAIEKSRVWLNLTNTEGAFKQTLVGYLTDATNEYEDRFDGESFDGNEFVDFYSLNQDMNLTIQGRALPFDENDEVPLGYRTTINGDFTINIAQVDGSLTNQAVFIEDKLTNTVTDLKSGNYTFNTAAGTFNERFVLKYTNKTLSLDATEKEDGILVLYSNNYKTLIIHNNVMDSTVNTVTLYNITGQKISNWDVKDSEQTTIQIPIKSISSGIYIVKVNTTIGESSKKIIVN